MSRLSSVKYDEHEVVEACRRAGWTLRHRSAPAAADRAALDRAAGELMDAEAGTPDGVELECLAMANEAYEDKHYPIGLP